jgi:hypothetical protein
MPVDAGMTEKSEHLPEEMPIPEFPDESSTMTSGRQN